MSKRILVLLLCLIMCLTSPLNILAEEIDNVSTEETLTADVAETETEAEESEETAAEVSDENTEEEQEDTAVNEGSEESSEAPSENEEASDVSEEAAEISEPAPESENASEEETVPDGSSDDEADEPSAEEISEISDEILPAEIIRDPAVPDAAAIPQPDAGIQTVVASGTCGTSLFWELSDDGTLNISGSGDMTDYSSGGAPWYSYRGQIKKVLFKSGSSITSIGDYAFFGCANLTLYYGIALPSSLKKIGRSAFNSCNALTYICIPANVTEIGSTAFGYCSSLKNATILGAPNMSAYVFYDCSALSEISFLGNAPAFGTQSFNAITAKVWYPSDNSSWTSDVMQNYNGSITWTSGYHGWCGDNISWDLNSGNGMLTLSGSGTTWFCASPYRHSYSTLSSKIKSIEVGEGITSLGQISFVNLSNVTTVTLPSTLVSIGNSVLSGTAITAITIPKNVNTLEAAFSGCNKLKEVHFLGHAPSSIGSNAFSGVTATVYYYPVPSWTDDKMQQYSGTLTWVKDDKIGDNVTWRMTNYPDEGLVYLSGSGATWDWPVEYPGFYNFRDEIKKVSVGSGITVLGTYLFFNLTQLKEAVLYETVTELRENLFYNCRNLKSIRFGGGAPSFADNVFKNVTATAYYLPIEDGGWTSSVMQNYGGSITWVCDNQVGDNVTWTLSSAGELKLSGSGSTWNYSYNDQHPGFYYSQMLVKSIYVEVGVTSIGDYLFYRMQKAASAKLMHTVKTIGIYAFRECYNLSSLELPDYLTEIGDSAFLGCYKLPSVDIPATVTKIGGYAFNDCTKLTEVHFLGHVPATMGNNIFYGDTVTAYYYPVYSWKEDKLQQYGGTVSWVCDKMIGDNVSWYMFEDGYMMIYGTDATWDYKNGYPGFHNFKDEIIFAEMSKDITYLGQFLFFNMSALETVIIDTGVTEIGNFCFAGGCLNLKEIYFAYKAPSFGVNPFVNVEATAYYLPIEDSGWTEDVMQDYGGSIDWILNDHVGDNVTWTLNSQGTVVLTGSGPTWDHKGFTTKRPGYYLCADYVNDIIVTSGITTLGDYLFYNLYELENVAVPNTIESIGILTFAYSTVKSIIIPPGVKKIGEAAFGWCQKLNEIYFHNHAPIIGLNAFSGINATAYYYPVYSWTSDKLQQYYGTINWVKNEKCGDNVIWKLESDGTLTLSGTGTTWEYAASPQDFLYFSDEITRAVVGEGVTKLNTEVFCDLDQMREVTLPSTLTTIGVGAFANSGLTSVNIPASVTVLDKRAFSGCSSLKEIYFLGHAPTFADNAFKDVTATAYYTAGDTTWTADKRQNYGGKITWMARNLFNLVGANMTLGNELSMNFFVNKSDIDTSKKYYIKIRKTYADGRADKVLIIPNADWTNYNSNYYSVKFNGVTAKEMNDLIYVQVFYEDETPASYIWTDSVSKYVLRILEKQDSITKTMLVDMLNYGAEAQIQLNYDKTNLANMKLSETQKAYATSSVTAEDHRIKGANYYGSNLNLGNNLKFSLFFEQITRDMYAVVSFTNHYGDAKTFRIEGSDFELYNSSNSIYRIYIEQMVLADARQLITCTVYNKDGSVAASASDSIESYIARMSSTGALYEAIMKFADSAYKFFHK